MQLSLRTPRTMFITFASAFTLLAGAALVSAPVRALTRNEPIDLYVDSIIPGEPVACTVELSGSPESITIYSDPPGVVSYEGAMASARETVMAATNPNAAPGVVTVYVQTDGATTVSDDTQVVGDPSQR